MTYSYHLHSRSLRKRSTSKNLFLCRTNQQKFLLYTSLITQENDQLSRKIRRLIDFIFCFFSAFFFSLLCIMLGLIFECFRRTLHIHFWYHRFPSYSSLHSRIQGLAFYKKIREWRKKSKVHRNGYRSNSNRLNGNNLFIVLMALLSLRFPPPIKNLNLGRQRGNSNSWSFGSHS